MLVLFFKIVLYVMSLIINVLIIQYLFTPILVIWHHSLNNSTSRPIIYVLNFSINFKILYIYGNMFV